MDRAERDFGIYVHVPWCRTRCPYCAFNVHVDRDAPWEAWRDGVLRDWSEQQPEFGDGLAHSLYLGGGTPSLAPAGIVGELVTSLPLRSDAEVTLEANPGTVSAAGLDALREAGVTRLSLGVQTFNKRFAHILNRGHTVAAARELVELVAASGFRSWSVDLIFGLPGQSLADLGEDLDALVALDPPHVSLYGLTMEPGTPFGRAAEQGRMRAADPELWRTMYDNIVERLADAGLDRYEVSNFARPGHRAVHNEAVWRGEPYAGLGPGAHGFTPAGRRLVNRNIPEDWMATGLDRAERPGPHERATDLVLTALRHVDGLDLTELVACSGHTIRPGTLAPLTRAGLLEVRGDRVRLTVAGYPLADGLVERLVDGLVPEPHKSAVAIPPDSFPT